MQNFNLVISTPQRLFFSGEAEQVIITSPLGEMGVLYGHEPMVVALVPCPVRIKTEDEWREAAVSGGFVKINGDNVVIIADAAEWPEEIELNRALEAKLRAEERLQNKLSEIEYVRSRIALQRAMSRIKTKHDK